MILKHFKAEGVPFKWFESTKRDLITPKVESSESLEASQEASTLPIDDDDKENRPEIDTIKVTEWITIGAIIQNLRRTKRQRIRIISRGGQGLTFRCVRDNRFECVKVYFNP